MHRIATSSRILVLIVTALIVGLSATDELPAQQVVNLVPLRDTSLYENNPNNSSGAGPTLFCGETNTAGARRMLLAFYVHAIPPGSVIQGAQLHMMVEGAGPASNPADLFSLHLLGESWGEAGSNAGPGGGRGVPAQPGDATWDHRFFPSVGWLVPGGTFAATPSSTSAIPTAGLTQWSSPQMVTEVQTWVDTNPAFNHGWLAKADNEAVGRKARRFSSREGANTPVLTVTFAPAPGSSRITRFLRIGKAAGGLLELTWGPACRITDTNYGVYEGSIGTWYSHVRTSCDTGGATNATVSPAAGNMYYLVVPHNGTNEGSYGLDSAGAERPTGIAGIVCHPQLLFSPVCP